MIGPATLPLPAAIALWSGAICLAIVVAVPTVGALYGRVRGKPESQVRNLPGHILGGAAIFAIPCAVAAVFAMFAGAALLAAAMLALNDPALGERLAAWRAAQTDAVPDSPA